MGCSDDAGRGKGAGLHDIVGMSSEGAGGEGLGWGTVRPILLCKTAGNQGGTP